MTMISDTTPSPISEDQEAREAALLRRVVDSFASCTDRRRRTLLTGLVEHLHAFIRETRLTEEEWAAAIDFLTRCGHITDDRRQEFILLSDVLGASMQTITVNNEACKDATEATVFGPFFVEDSPHIPLGGDISQGATGQPCWVEGTVRSTEGRPLPHARLEIWEADDDGFYDVQYADDRTAARGHLFADEDGVFNFWAITPTPYPIPHDGPVGELLASAGRSPMRASHLHFMVSAPGHRTLVTHIFVSGDEFLASDSVFGVKPSLVKDFLPQTSGSVTPDGREIADEWTRVRFDIVLPPT